MKEIIKIGSDYIFIGEGAAINDFSHLSAYKEAPITIGKNTIVGPFAMMNTGNHNYKSLKDTIQSQGHTKLPITIGEDVWIGARVTVLYGSNIPDKCVIGANSLVTRHNKLEMGCVYTGSPLKLIGKRRNL